MSRKKITEAQTATEEPTPEPTPEPAPEPAPQPPESGQFQMSSTENVAVDFTMFRNLKLTV